MTISYVLRLRGSGAFNFVKVTGPNSFTNTFLMAASTFSSSLEALEFADQFPDEAMTILRVES